MDANDCPGMYSKNSPPTWPLRTDGTSPGVPFSSRQLFPHAIRLTACSMCQLHSTDARLLDLSPAPFFFCWPQLVERPENKNQIPFRANGEPRLFAPAMLLPPPPPHPLYSLGGLFVPSLPSLEGIGMPSSSRFFIPLSQVATPPMLFFSTSPPPPPPPFERHTSTRVFFGPLVPRPGLESPDVPRSH